MFLHFIDIHPRTNSVKFEFNLSTDSGSNYNVTKTTTAFQAYHTESDSAAGISYTDGEDLAQSTNYQNVMYSVSSASDGSGGGSMTLFNPSSTTYVKHFISISSFTNPNSDYMINQFVAGYGNTTSAINAIRFQMSSGNFDGIIKLYGVKKS